MEAEHGEKIPDHLNAEAYIASRLKELNALSTFIGESNKVSTSFQRLPKHMRRRAMSHSVKRVPKNLRTSHQRQLMKNKALKKTKKARKYHRKRPKRLILEYNRRQKTKTWLETHMWHAKRFRMCTKWNYKIAESSYEKTFRAVYRATKAHCLIQDISYYCCVELRGFVDTLADKFKRITNPDCGLSIRAKCWRNGSREGNIVLFRADSYPYNVIGKVDFMWKPSTDESQERILWLWCHPSIHDEIVQELVRLFALISEEIESKIPTFINASERITMMLLKDKLNRFRLTGPLSNAVLTKALHPAETYDHVLSNLSNNTWWVKFGNQTEENNGSLKLLRTHPQPFLFPAHSILGCNIVDPRLFLKRKKSKAMPESEDSNYCTSVPTSLVHNAIWEADIRDEVSAVKLTTAKLDALRSELLIPGFDEQLLKTVNNVIPILLVQKPGVCIRGVKSNYCSGWDLILPDNWAMPVWQSLILCGGRAGALRETRTISFESQQAPEMCPDSKAGKEYYAELKSRNENMFFKKPPRKRVNYIKFGIPTPFYHNWSLLVQEWCSSTSVESFFVFRNRYRLLQMQEEMENFKQRNSFSTFSSLPSNSLIPVTVTMLVKGNLTPFSHICLPTVSDMKQHMQGRCFSGPSEAPHPDIFKEKRKFLRSQHIKELKRLRRKRIKEKRKRMEMGLPLKIMKRVKSPTEAEVQAYLRQMRDLWIPFEVTKLRKHCSRDVCGFIISSGFSFLKSCVIGQGYVVAEALQILCQLAKECKSNVVVLSRSPNSLNYRLCRINIIVTY